MQIVKNFIENTTVLTRTSPAKDLVNGAALRVHGGVNTS